MGAPCWRWDSGARSKYSILALCSRALGRLSALLLGPHSAGGSSLLAAADWYSEHLNFGVPIVVVSDALAATVHRSSLAEASAAAKAGQVVVRFRVPTHSACELRVPAH